MLGFQSLDGQRWPPTAPDMQEAESLCRQLGLADLEHDAQWNTANGWGGWLAARTANRSRVYIARALLGVTISGYLDDNFAALDPENLRLALTYTLERAPYADGHRAPVKP